MNKPWVPRMIPLDQSKLWLCQALSRKIPLQMSLGGPTSLHAELNRLAHFINGIRLGLMMELSIFSPAAFMLGGLTGS